MKEVKYKFNHRDEKGNVTERHLRLAVKGHPDNAFIEWRKTRMSNPHICAVSELTWTIEDDDLKPFPTHDEIEKSVRYAVDMALHGFNTEHNRKSLVSLIAGLQQYEKTLPTIDEYIEVNEL